MLRKYNIKTVLPLIFMMAITGCAGGGGGGNSYTAELEWAPPSTYTDGSTFSPANIGGYKIYYGTMPGSYIDCRYVGSTTSILISSLKLPTRENYYVAVTVYDSVGNESAFSNEVSIAAGLIPHADD